MKKTFLIFGLVLMTAILVMGCTMFSQKSDTIDTQQEQVTVNVEEAPQEKVQPTEPGIYEVKIENMQFTPSELTIKVGETVVWNNRDSTTHKIKTTDGNEISTVAMSKGARYVHKFTTAGTYDYICSIHPSMKGKITVE